MNSTQTLLMNSTQTLFKKDTTGRMRVWHIDFDHEKFRMVTGLEDGAKVESNWRYPTEKNIGRANATTIAEQVEAEVKANVEKKLWQGKYFEDRQDAENEVQRFVAPMLADKYEKRYDPSVHIFSQPKLDGVRAIGSDQGITSRQGKPIISCPHIEDEIHRILEDHPEIVLDGELYNHEYKSEFEKIISLVRKQKLTEKQYQETADKVEYHVYDLIDKGNPNATFSNRMSILRDIVESLGENSPIKLVPTQFADSQEAIDNLYGRYIEDGYEGQMLRANTPYEENKRSKNLLKRKSFDDAEFAILDIEEGLGNWSGAAKAIFIDLGDGQDQKSGVRGKYEFLQKVLNEKEKYIGGTVTVRYQGKTNTNRLRFPVVVAIFENERDM